jgi:hypothetical protein
MEHLQSIYQRFPKAAWAATLGVIGFILGLLLGNVGLATRGGAIGVAGSAVGAVLGAYVGFRVGEWRGRKRATTTGDGEGRQASAHRPQH